MKIWIALVFSVLVISGCSRDECKCCGSRPTVECISEEVGQLALHDSTAYWLENVPDSVHLSNNKGFSVVLYTSRYHNNYNLEVSLRKESDGCEESTSCSDYCVAEQDGVQFNATNFTLLFRLTRQPKTNFKELSKTKPVYGEVKSVGDILSISIWSYIKSTNYSTTFADALFKQKITLNNIQIDSVYEISTPSQNPKMIYVKKGFGLVGYILSNNEEWTITK